jgi:hypothetical protein
MDGRLVGIGMALGMTVLAAADETLACWSIDLAVVVYGCLIGS